jgi:hypothetical protein
MTVGLAEALEDEKDVVLKSNLHLGLFGKTWIQSCSH